MNKGILIYIFLVLATDGLYDYIDSKQVASIVANKKTSQWNKFIKDENSATSLIVHAMANEDESNIRKMMSIPVTYSRRYRDDMTVSVLFFGKAPQPRPV